MSMRLPHFLLFSLVSFISISSQNVMPDQDDPESASSEKSINFNHARSQVPPYNQGGWPTLHFDAHNSDHVPTTMGTLNPNYDPILNKWILKEADYPMVSLVGGTIGSYPGVDVFFATPGKVEHSNLYAFDLSDGTILWKAAPPIAAENEFPGPGPCVTSTSTLLDDAGNIYTADCKYIYCYKMDDKYNSLGEKAWEWREVLPNLRYYDPDQTPFSEYDWFPTSDPNANFAMAKPFIALQFTPVFENTSYIVGVSVQGDLAAFNPTDGTAYAYSHLEKNLNLNLPMNYGEPCDPYEFTELDDPMYFVPGEDDGLIPFGIWTTGSNTGTGPGDPPNPDLDYFMNPCQINKYLGANTGGVGSMITNTPAVSRDPRPGFENISRIFIPGAQSEYLSGFDTPNSDEDAILYRIDFNPLETFENRFRVLNNEEANGFPIFDGRMTDGENSAASPDISLNEKWTVTSGNHGKFYNFDTETGQRIWDDFGYSGYVEIGNLLSTATALQRVEANGTTYIISFGESKVWVIGVDPDSGALAPKTGTNPAEADIRVFDFRDYILTNYWRPEPEYQQDYGIDGNGDGDLNDPEDTVYERVAVGASIHSASDDLVFSVYSVGWHEPGRPSLFFIPTHSVILILNLKELLSRDPLIDPLESVIAGCFIDTRGTSEAGIIPALKDGLPKGVIIYGSQSTSLAQFMDVNDMMVDEVKPLYMKPFGGLGILEFVAEVRQLFYRWPGGLNVTDFVTYINDDPE